MSDLTVDQHIAKGNELLHLSEQGGWVNETSTKYAAQATAHFAAATALISRFAQSGYNEVGNYK